MSNQRITTGVKHQLSWWIAFILLSASIGIFASVLVAPDVGLVAGTVTAVVIAAARALRDAKFAWGLYVLSLGMSGLELNAFGVKILPEHVGLGILLLSSLGNQMASRRATAADRGILLLLSLWWITLLVVSAFAAIDSGQSIRLLVWLLTNLAAAIVVFRLPIVPSELVRIGLKVTASYGALLLLAWVFASVGGVETIFVEADYASSSLRLQGLLQEPNLLAGLFTLWAGVAYMYRRQLARSLVMTYLAIGWVVVLLTFTRVAWITFPVIALMVLIRTFRASAVLPIIIVGAGLALIGPLVLNAQSVGQGNPIEGVVARIGNLVDFTSGTGALRAMTTDVALNDLRSADAWMTGFGFNAYPQVHEGGVTDYATAYLGNLWVVLVYDGGLIAAGAFVGALIVLWVKTAKYGSTVIVVAFALISATTNPIWFAFPWVLFALVLLRRERPTLSDGVPRRWSLAEAS